MHPRSSNPDAVAADSEQPGQVPHVPTELPLTVHVVPVDGHVVVVVCGEIDPVTAPRLRAALGEAIVQSPRVVLDLSQVTFIDSAGIAVLVDVHHQSGQNVDALVLRMPSAVTTRLLQITGLDKIFAIEDEDATRSANR